MKPRRKKRNSMALAIVGRARGKKKKVMSGGVLRDSEGNRGEKYSERTLFSQVRWAEKEAELLANLGKKYLPPNTKK